MVETMTLRDLVSFVNGAQSNIQLKIKRVFPVPGTTRGGTYIACGDAEYPLSNSHLGDGALIEMPEVASMFRHLGQEDLLPALFPDLS